MVDVAYYQELLRPVFAGRKVIVATDVLQGAANSVPFLQGVGAERPFLLAGLVGTGPVPTTDEAEQHVLGVSGDGSMMGGIRVFENALQDLPAETLAALDAYDPDGEAIVLGSLFSAEGEVAGRRVYGGRPKTWEALEDKTAIDAVLARAGIDLAPSEVVDVAHAKGVASRFDRGDGTAWAGDARDGWWGGATYFRWVRSDEDAAEAGRFFALSCDRVRVMPFLEGIPCAIHGMVFEETVIAFRPVEMLTLRCVGRNRLLYTGVSTFWDPPDADRHAMRDIARRVGAMLRDHVDYRGMFTLDGVLTEDGFLPTELNPRPGAGATPMIAASGVNLMALNKAVIEREPVDFRPDELEEHVVSKSDAARGGSPFTMFQGSRTETEFVQIVKRGAGYARLAEGEHGDGTLMFGPSVAGGLVRYLPDPTQVPVGASLAPTAAEIFAFTDVEFGTGLGPLEPAREVR